MPRDGMDENSRLLVIDENETSSSSFAEDFESTTTSNNTRSSFYPSFINVSVLKSIAIATVSVAAFSLALLKASSTASVGEKNSQSYSLLGLSDLAHLGSHRRRSTSFSDIIVPSSATVRKGPPHTDPTHAPARASLSHGEEADVFFPGVFFPDVFEASGASPSFSALSAAACLFRMSW